ncbi:MAG: hypothetical protein QOE93_738 [Actinomycetota bacterium]|nr:hypothetical protein [Actinomycetota bacterium]
MSLLVLGGCGGGGSNPAPTGAGSGGNTTTADGTAAPIESAIPPVGAATPESPAPAGETPAGATAPVTLPPKPTAQDIQNAVLAITAQLSAPPAPGMAPVPLTREEIKAIVKEQLKALGINY